MTDVTELIDKTFRQDGSMDASQEVRIRTLTGGLRQSTPTTLPLGDTATGYYSETDSVPQKTPENHVNIPSSIFRDVTKKYVTN